MIFVDVDNGFGTKDYLVDEKAKCSEIIKELSGSETGGYCLSESRSTTVLSEELSLKEQGITSGCKLRLRRYSPD